MEIRRFGVGNRRPDGPAGSFGVTGQAIETDPRVVISELAFGSRAALESHSSPTSAWFIVIEGGGFVAVGDERARVAAGEAVLWPAGVIHQAWTDGSQMRAIVVELGPDDGAVPSGSLLAGGGLLGTGETVPAAVSSTDPNAAPKTPPTVTRGEGALATQAQEPHQDPEAGEPL
jgi:mannose-6-phosphate isomerase-like protein (cupin superfamily)